MYTPLIQGVPITLSGAANAWHTLNSGAPVGSSGVELGFTTTSTAMAVTVRKTGSTDAQTNSNTIDGGERFRVRVGVDAQARFDYYANSISGVTCYLLGYYSDEAVFFDNATALSWQTPPYTYDLTVQAPGAIAAFLTCYNQSAFNASAGGLADPSDSWSPALNTQDWIVGLKNNQFTVRAGSTPTAWYLRGYMTKGFVWRPNAEARTAGTSWHALGLTRSAVAYLYMLTGGGAITVAMGSGSAPQPGNLDFSSTGQMQMVITGPPYETNQNGTPGVNEQAYFLGPIPSRLDPVTSPGTAGISSGSLVAYYSDSGLAQRRTSDILGARTGKRGVRK